MVAIGDPVAPPPEVFQGFLSHESLTVSRKMVGKKYRSSYGTGVRWRLYVLTNFVEKVKNFITLRLSIVVPTKHKDMPRTHTHVHTHMATTKINVREKGYRRIRD